MNVGKIEPILGLKGLNNTKYVVVEVTVKAKTV
jgi:hypothetical protein